MKELFHVISKIISPNQSGFVKGRSINENLLLAQEIIGDIKRRNNYENVMVKLGMGKAYDRVSWVYLTKVFRMFGFSKVMIDMIWTLLSDNCY
ncbi:MAG: reverse transcriptase domain-containing protein [Candidatus Phytoplasma australasiaticum]|nr:reverse transcriptase domain-containing protein [Candidatus Phytoplasma australasiaticum]